MKVWCVPVTLPDPEKEPEQAAAAKKFIERLKGLVAISTKENGLTVLVFKERRFARSAMWTFEEFGGGKFEIIEGTLSSDRKELRLNKVLKGE